MDMGLLMDAINAIKSAFTKVSKDLRPVLAEFSNIIEKHERRPYDPRLAHRKGKSQRKNWKKWRGRK
jgi:hypothetical protein